MNISIIDTITKLAKKAKNELHLDFINPKTTISIEVSLGTGYIYDFEINRLNDAAERGAFEFSLTSSSSSNPENSYEDIEIVNIKNIDYTVVKKFFVTFGDDNIESLTDNNIDRIELTHIYDNNWYYYDHNHIIFYDVNGDEIANINTDDYIHFNIEYEYSEKNYTSNSKPYSGYGVAGIHPFASKVDNSYSSLEKVIPMKKAILTYYFNNLKNYFETSKLYGDNYFFENSSKYCLVPPGGMLIGNVIFFTYNNDISTHQASINGTNYNLSLSQQHKQKIDINFINTTESVYKFEIKCLQNSFYVTSCLEVIY